MNWMEQLNRIMIICLSRPVKSQQKQHLMFLKKPKRCRNGCRFSWKNPLLKIKNPFLMTKALILRHRPKCQNPPMRRFPLGFLSSLRKPQIVPLKAPSKNRNRLKVIPNPLCSPKINQYFQKIYPQK